ncbi:hypothetical protein BH11BAC6_BH11BAC6_09390 [soil metagenome]
MRTVKVLISFSKYSESVLVTIVTAALLAITGNLNFTTPVPSLASIQTLLDNFTTALAEAAGRDRTKIAIKNAIKADLIEAMKQLAIYINFICMGDLAKLTSANLPMSKIPAPRIIGNPENLRVTTGQNPGSLLVKTNTVKGADGYQFFIAPVTGEAPVWTIEACSRSQFLFTRLDSGVNYQVKVSAIGSNGQVTYSTIETQYTQ